jgi:hypothetical protein
MKFVALKTHVPQIVQYECRTYPAKSALPLELDSEQQPLEL